MTLSALALLVPIIYAAYLLGAWAGHHDGVRCGCVPRDGSGRKRLRDSDVEKMNEQQGRRNANSC